MDINEKDFFDQDPMTQTGEPRPDPAITAEISETAATSATPPAYNKRTQGMHDTAPVSFPLPPKDYKNGKLKKIRGRMLKKLLKYELKYMLLPLCILAGITLSLSLILGVTVRLSITSQNVPFIDMGEAILQFILLFMLFVFSIMALVIMPIGLAETRMHKNFFQGEGAVTFSLPASAEEHLFAKHLGAMISSGIAIVTAILSILLLSLLTNGMFMDSGTTLPAEKPENVFVTILSVTEAVVLCAELFLGMPVILGAACCFLYKFTRKQQMLIIFLTVFGFSYLSGTLTTLAYTTEIFQFFQTEWGAHIFLWINIVLLAGVVAACYLYELRTIKHKINL